MFLNKNDIRRIYNCNHNVKLILFVRNPIDRAWSSFRFSKRNKSFDNIDLNEIIKFVDSEEQTKQGDYRLAPETIASNFVGNRFEPNFLKIRDIMEVGEFARNQGLEGAEEGIDSVTGVLDRIIRNARK